MKYRKKPVVIDAVQWTNGADPSDLQKIHELAGGLADRVIFAADGTAALVIKTLEGEMRADVGDFIIRGVKGELYPCKPDIFAATYGGAGGGRAMIVVRPSPTADTRTCDFANTPKETLLASSRQHIADVGAALAFFGAQLTKAAVAHDTDKLTDIDGFHSDFVHGFAEPDYTGWWRRHRELNRHHLTYPDGTPLDVNLVDVLDFIADCVMAGMARSGSVYPLALPPELLERAFQNTVELLKSQVVVDLSER